MRPELPYSPLQVAHPPRPWPAWRPDDAPLVLRAARRRAAWVLLIGLLLLSALALGAFDQPYQPDWAPAWHAAERGR